jgi:hypothetical protein
VPISGDVTVKPINSLTKEMFKMKDSTLARKAAVAGMAGAVLWIIATIWGYASGPQAPEEGAMYVARQLLYFAAMAGIAVGFLGILWGNGINGRFGKISTGMVALGYLLLIVVSFFQLFPSNEDSPIFILFPIGGLLMALGVLLTGIGVARAGSWRGWQRWMPLIYAAFLWLAIQVPLIAGVNDGPGTAPEILMGAGLFLVALATYTAAAEDSAVELKGSEPNDSVMQV